MNPVLVGAVLGGICGAIFGNKKDADRKNPLTPSKKDANNKKDGETGDPEQSALIQE